MVTVGIVAALAIAGITVVGISALTQLRAGNEQVRKAELELRTHLQAQVDDLHAKVLSHNWEEYGNAVGQRSAFDRAVAAEMERNTAPFGTSESLDEQMSRHLESFQDDMEGGPVVG